MDREVAQWAHEILTRASAMPAGARAEYVARACGEHEGLRARLAGLLAALEGASEGGAGGFLETPALEGARGTAQEGVADGAGPEKVGSYCVLRTLGAGGMATVYEAEQSSPRRRVAVKLMRRALVSPRAVARFKFETEVLAKLRHPGIAQIYEAGTWDGGVGEDGTGGAGGAGVESPYFSMEFVPGARPLTRYVREEGLGRAERIGLFLEICDAVQYGHQSGVIHRDLKPGNLLVDAQGRPKVIDFGVARSTEGGEDGGAEAEPLVGTLNYMAPEQCVVGGAVDTRCDVYALGVVLYELVCGRLPHDLGGVALPEALRVIREEAPPRPGEVEGSVRGDLELIVLKAIEKDPDRRYLTVAALAADLRRMRAFLPIEARAAGVGYQVRLFARRNRPAVASGVVVLVTVLVGAVMSFTFAWREREESQRRRAAETLALAQRDAALHNAYVATLAAGFAAYEAGELRQVRTQLGAAPAGLRGWEWRFLRAASDRSVRTVAAHGDMVLDLAADRESGRLATAGRDGRVRVWDAGDGRRVADLRCPGGVQAHSVALEPGGGRVAAGLDDGAVVVWEVATGRVVREARLHDRRVTRVAWVGGGIVASVSADRRCLVWGVEDGVVVEDLGARRGVAASADGTRLATWGRDGIVRVRTGVSGAWTELDFGEAPECVAIGADGRHIAAAGAKGRVMVWDLTAGGAAADVSVAGTESLVRTVAFSPDGARLAVGLGDRSVRLVPVGGDGVAERLTGHEEAVSGVAFSRDGGTMYSGSWDGTVRFWGVTREDREGGVRRVGGHEGMVLSAAFSPDGGMVASAGRDHTVRLFEPESGAGLGVLRGHTDDVAAVAFSPDGGLLATGSYDRTVRLWETKGGRAVGTLAGHTRAVWTVAFSPDGAWLASGGDDGVVRVWDVRGQKVVRELSGHGQRVIRVAFGPDGRTLASASRDHTVRLWDAGTGALLRVLEGHTSDVFALAFSADGRTLYSGSRDQTVCGWEVGTGRRTQTMDGHGQFVTGLAVSPDGSRLAAGSWFGQVLLWDLPGGRLVASFGVHTGVIRSVAFSPDGRWLAASCADGAVRLLDTAEPSDRVRGQAEATRAMEAARRAIEAGAAEDGMGPAVRKWMERLRLRGALEGGG